MNKILSKSIALLALIFLVSFNSFATHIMAVDITYVCLGGNDYEYTLTVFSDCAGTTPGTSYDLDFTSTSCGENFSVTLDQFGTEEEVSSVCITSVDQTTCNGGSIPGTMAYIYKGLVTMPDNCSDWVISWNDCCRNAGITNLQTPDTRDIYVQVTMDNTNGICNNSPQYASLPVPYICANQLFTYNHGAYDIDGDSLVYALAQPLELPGPPGTAIPFTNGYSITDPVQSSNGFNFNPLTGEMCFTPDQQQICVVSVIISEYRSGTLIATHIREMQVIVSSVCSNVPPTIGTGGCSNIGGLSNLTGGSSVIQVDSNVITMCPDDFLTFDMEGFDGATDSVTITSNVGVSIPGATITYTNNSVSNTPIATFNWIPTAADTGTNVFTVTLTDNACPIQGVQNFTFIINVWTSTSAGPDQTICGPSSEFPGDAQLSAIGGTEFVWSVISGDPLVEGVNFSCDTCPNPIATPTITTTYEVVSNLDAACKFRDTVTVFVVPDFTFTTTQNMDSICLYGSVDFEIIPTIPGNYSYKWHPSIVFTNDSISNPTGTFSSSGLQTVYVDITSPDGCLKSDTLFVEVSTNAQPNVVLVTDTSICMGDSTQMQVEFVNQTPCSTTQTLCNGSTTMTQVGSGNLFTADDTQYPAPYGNWYFGAKHQILFTAAELQTLGLAPGIISSLSLRVQSISGTSSYDNFQIKMGCTSVSNLTTWETGLSIVHPAQTVNITTGWNTHSFTNGFSWDGVSNLVVEICFNNTNWTNNSPTFYSTTAFTSVIYFRDDINNACASTTNTGTSFNRPQMRFESCKASDGPYSFSWSPTNWLSDSTITNPMVIANSDTSYTYTFVIKDTIGGCSDTTNITVHAVPSFTYVKSQSDTAICLYASAEFTASPDSVNTYTYSWTPSAIFADDSVAIGVATFDQSGVQTVGITMTNAEGCSKTDTFNILVSTSAQPLFNILGDTTVCIGDSTQMDLEFTTPSPCGVSTDACNGPTTDFTVGTGTNSNSSTTYPAPYGNFYYGARHQLLFTATELQALGFESGIISSLALNIQTITGVTLYEEFEIKIGCTSLSDLITWETGLSTVFPAQSINISAGWNTHDFTSNYVWDGTSNLVVEICFNNTDFDSNSSTFYTSTSFNSVLYSNADLNNVCSSTGTINQSTNRPNVRFGTCKIKDGPYSYAWTPSIWLSDSTIKNPVITPLSDTTYYLTVTDTIGGCSTTDSINVYVAPSFSLTGSQTETSVCLNGSADFSVVADIVDNYTYQWTVNNSFVTGTNDTLTVVITTPGVNVVTVAVTNDAGCTRYNGYTIKASSEPAPDAFILGDTTICAGDSTQLTISSSTSNNTFFDDFDPITNAYWLTNTSVADVVCGSVTGNARYFRAAGNRELATNALSLPYGANVIFWLKYGTLGTLNNQCDSLDSSAEEVVLEYSTDNGTTWVILNQYAFNAYPNFTQIGEALPVGAYSNNTQIRWRQLAHDGANQDIWALDNITISKTNMYDYVWTPSTGLNSSTIYNPMATLNSDQMYTVSMTDTIGGCSDDVTFTVHVAPNFTFTTSQSVDSICLNGTVQITVTPDQTDTYTYTWFGQGVTFNNSSNSVTATFGTAGDITVYYQITSAGGCTKYGDVLVTVSTGQQPNLIINGNTTYCEGGSTTLTASNINGSSMDTYAISWTPIAGLGTPNSASTTASPTATTQYTVSVVDTIGGCTGSTGITVTVNPNPVVSITTSQSEFCASDAPFTFVGTPNGTWTGPVSPLGVFSPSSALVGPQTLTFTVSQNGCSASEQVPVTVYGDPATPVATANNPYCEGSTVTDVSVTSSGGTVNWYNDVALTSPFTSISSFTATQDTLYFQETSAQGCASGVGSFVINTVANPNLSLTATPTTGFIPLDVLFTTSSTSSIVSYYWEINGVGLAGPPTSPYTFDSTGVYTVYVVGADINGCTGSASVEIIVEDKMKIPTVFTPNGDGINDRFEVDTQDKGEFTIVILNRWGKQVFECNGNAGNCFWNGKIKNGSDAAEGTYYYIVTGKDIKGEPIDIENGKGYVTLLRN